MLLLIVEVTVPRGRYHSSMRPPPLATGLPSLVRFCPLYVMEKTVCVWLPLAKTTSNLLVPGATLNPGSVRVPKFDALAATAMPVVLVRFSATPRSGKILLEWNTATEQNNKGFEVERSADGRSWNKLGFVPGMGTTVEANNYSFWDEKPVTGPNHYRLKQTDLDGRFVYSPIVSVENEADGRSGLRLFPNPAPQGITSLVVPEAPEGDGFLEVFDGLGQLVLYQKLALDHGQPFPLNLSGHPAGMYTVRLEIGGNVHMERLMVGK